MTLKVLCRARYCRSLCVRRFNWGINISLNEVKIEMLRMHVGLLRFLFYFCSRQRNNVRCIGVDRIDCNRWCKIYFQTSTFQCSNYRPPIISISGGPAYNKKKLKRWQVYGGLICHEILLSCSKPNGSTRTTGYGRFLITELGWREKRKSLNDPCSTISHITPSFWTIFTPYLSHGIAFLKIGAAM